MKFPAYFEVYGGLNSVVRSPYFWAAGAMTALCAGFFAQAGWWDLAIAVVPGLVGFSIAGIAIFISLGSDKLREVIAGREEGSAEPSPFMLFMSMFTHFIVVQLIALLVALTSKMLYGAAALDPNPFEGLAEVLRLPFWILGGFALTYAVFLSISLATEIFRIARIIDEIQTDENESL